jgi:hypothetical protein
MPIVVNAVVNNTTVNTGYIDATVTGGTPPYAFSWSNGASTQDISDLIPGTYILSVTDLNGCISTNEFIVEDALSLHDLGAMSAELSVYPNPTSSSTTVQINGSLIEKISLVDMFGKTVYEASPEVSKVELQTATFEQGMYFLHVVVEGKTTTRKLNIIR